MQFLAILNVAPGADMRRVEALAAPEARRLWDLYTQGVVRSPWYRTDTPGAILLLEAPDEGAARAAIDSFPMVRESLLTVEVIPLAPYDGLESLFTV